MYHIVLWIHRTQVKQESFSLWTSVSHHVGCNRVLFLCWLPYHIVHLILIYREKSSSLAVSLVYFNSCLNSVLYVFMGQDFKSNVSLRRVFERVSLRRELSREVSRSTVTTHALTVLKILTHLFIHFSMPVLCIFNQDSFHFLIFSILI